LLKKVMHVPTFNGYMHDFKIYTYVSISADLIVLHMVVDNTLP